VSPARRRGAPGRRIEVLGLGRFPAARPAGLAGWGSKLLDVVDPAGGTLAVRLVGDRTMRGINREFRGIDATTDVLSFPGGETPEGPHLGDVVISVPRAAEQARAAGHRTARELRVLLLHGVLHCLGYDHENDDGEMERTERRLRRRLLNGD